MKETMGAGKVREIRFSRKLTKKFCVKRIEKKGKTSCRTIVQSFFLKN